MTPMRSASHSPCDAPSAASASWTPLYIRANDRSMYELEVLPLREDSMDWLELLIEIETELGVKVPDREAERLRQPFTVRQMVHDTLGVVQRMREGSD
jgi:acyl carrier protein